MGLSEFLKEPAPVEYYIDPVCQELLQFDGLDSACKQGRISGRRPKLKAHQQEEIVHLVTSGQKTAADAARLFNIHLLCHVFCNEARKLNWVLAVRELLSQVGHCLVLEVAGSYGTVVRYFG